MISKRNLLSTLLIALFFITPYETVFSVEDNRRNSLAIKNGRFVVRGTPTFLLGISYFDGMSANQEILQSDLTQLESLGFRAIRVWATWYRDHQPRFVSLIRKSGQIDPVAVRNLRRLLEVAQSKGFVVDLTFSRDPIAPISFEDYRRAIRSVAVILKPHREVLFDVQNETNHCGSSDDPECERHLRLNQVGLIRAAVREVDPARLVTASRNSFGLTPGVDDYAAFVSQANIDWIATHRPTRTKDAVWAQGTDNEVRLIRSVLGPAIPIVFDEPNRCQHRIDCEQETSIRQFLLAARNAKREGAAGWFFHTKASFKLSNRSLFRQLQRNELRAVKRLHSSLKNIAFP